MNRQQFFEIHADDWDSFITKDLIKKIKNVIIPFIKIKRGDNILDVGSGTGILLPFFKKAVGKNGKVVALDYSQKMLERAKSKYGDEFEYICANAEKTPFKDNTFDVVVCFSVFPHFSKKLKVLKELFRVLKFGGRIVISHAQRREEINAFHNKVSGPVAKDFIPEDNKVLDLLKRAGFKFAKVVEQKGCYFAMGDKV